ncbi:MAG: hypothetical protein ACU0HS_18055 [Paracoccus sp. (in: a-proteobacteria)]|uniref:hypothetical protein n=1 Tax=Rhodobacterales TaxID=204455 RepID=UPI0040580157
MSYRITTYSALQANLSAAGTTLGLSRAALCRLPLPDTERAETIERLRKQISELEAMILELEGPGRKQSAPFLRTRRRKAPAPRRADAVSNSTT